MDGVIVEFDHFPAIMKALHKAATLKAQETALAIVREAASNHPWQNQSGQAASTFYVVMRTFSTYGVGFMESGKSALLAEIAPPDDDQTAYVSNASAYFPYLELGTSRIAAMPSLMPAAESQRSAFQSGEGWEQALVQLVGL